MHADHVHRVRGDRNARALSLFAHSPSIGKRLALGRPPHTELFGDRSVAATNEKWPRGGGGHLWDNLHAASAAEGRKWNNECLIGKERACCAWP